MSKFVWIRTRRGYVMMFKRLLCKIVGHNTYTRWEEEKFDLSRLGHMEKYTYCARCYACVAEEADNG